MPNGVTCLRFSVSYKTTLLNSGGRFLFFFYDALKSVEAFSDRVRDAHLLTRCAEGEVTNQQEHPETLPCTQ